MAVKSVLNGLAISLIGFAQTAKGNLDLQFSAVEDQTVTCNDETREFVLTSDNPLLSCPTNLDMTQSQINSCKEIVACMIEEGIVVEKDTLIKFGGIVGSSTTSGGGPVQVPTKSSN